MENIEMRMVEKAKIMSCMKCPICDGLYKEATTISGCLHTFCKECIHEKLEDEKEYCCPVCNIYLGASPLEKLRADHAVEDLKEKIFPSQRSQGETYAFQTPCINNNTEPVEVQVAYSVADPPSIQLSKPLATEEEKMPVEPSAESSIVQPPKADTCAAEPSVVQPFVAELSEVQMTEDEMPVKETTRKDAVNPTSDPHTNEGREVSGEGNEDLNEPLSRLVIATRNKNTRISSKGSGDKSSARSKSQAPTSNPKKLKRNKGKDSTASTNSVFSSPKQTTPIWLSLAASKDQECDEPLPQISPKFLRLKNGDMTVSVLKKYLMKKLDLESEEVELRLLEKKLHSELKLKSLVDLWVESGPSDRTVQVAVGSSAEEIVMVLTYGRNGSSSSPHKDTSDA